MDRRKKTTPANSEASEPIGTSDTPDDKVATGDPARQSRFRIARWEWIVLAITTLEGFHFRGKFFNFLEIEHFDEGVYASDIWFDADNNFQYPDRHLYAPPLLPELVEWMHIFFGATPFAAFGVSLFFGCLTVPLIWWVGRRWFGPQAGLIAALLLATCDIHVLYSRRALTEAMFCFWFLLGVHCGWESLNKLLQEKVASRSSQLWAITAGVSIGLCWLTKYNGWLPLAVLISGSIAFLIMSRASLALWKQVGGHLILITAIAGLFFGPYVWTLQDVGGYASVATNHRQYFVGLTGWWNSLVTQLATLGHFESYLSVAGFCSLPIIFLSLFHVFQGQENVTKMNTHSEMNQGRITVSFWALVLTILLLMALSFVPSLFVSGIAGLIILVLGTTLFLGSASLRNLVRGRQENEGSPGELDSPPTTIVKAMNQPLGFWLLAAWLFGLLVAIPLYTPYPRLIVPFLPALFLGFGMTMQIVHDCLAPVERNDRVSTDQPVTVSMAGLRLAKFVVAIAAVPVMSMVVGILPIDRSFAPPSIIKPPFDPSFDRDPCLEIFRRTQSERDTLPRIIYVYGEPAVFYQLNAQEMVDQTEALIGPIGNLDFADPGAPKQPVPVFLIVGPHAEKSPLFKEQWEKYGDQFELITKEEFTPSDFVLLNDMPAWELRDPKNADRRRQTLRLYKQKIK